MSRKECSENLRPAGIPYGIAADEHDPYRDTDFAEALRKVRRYKGNLCTRCEHIDFAGYFDCFRGPREITLSLGHTLREKGNCVFCGLLAAAALEQDECLQMTEDSDVELICQPWLVGARGGLPQPQICPQLAIALFEKINERQPAGSWEGRDGSPVNTMDWGYDVRKPLLVLELVGEPTSAAMASPDSSIAPPSTSDSDDTSSDDSDFEITYSRRLSKAWRSRRVRLPMAAQIDYERIKEKLRKDDVLLTNSKNDIDKRDNKGLLRLIDTGRLRMLDVHTGCVVMIREANRYLTLSYVWGDHRFEDTAINRNLESESVAWRVNWEHVPRTICGAAAFTKQLGERYLWVDSLCIDQKDEEDKKVLIPEMMTIYGCSYLTIFAAAGQDARFGLPGVNQDSRAAEICFEFTSRGELIRLLPLRPTAASIIQRSALNTRAWCYQEHLLSPRCIFFTEIEAFMSFGDHIIVERQVLRPYHNPYITEPQHPGLPGIDADAHAKPELHTHSLIHSLYRQEPLTWKHYCEAIVAYTLRNLTKAEDRLGAFMGMFNRFNAISSHHYKSQVLYGLPAQWFYQSLLWQPNYRSLEWEEHKRVPFDIKQKLQAPSWSWAGWTGRINLPESRQKKARLGVEVNIIDDRNIQCKSLTFGSPQPWPFEPSPCDPANSQSVVLHLWVTTIRLLIRRTRFLPSAKCDVIYSYGNSEHRSVAMLQLSESQASVFCNGELQLFLVFDTMIMLVNQHGDYWERIALGQLRYTKDENDKNVVQVREGGQLQYIKLR